LRTSEGETIYRARASLLNDLKKSPDDLQIPQVVKFNRDDAEEIILRWDKKRVHLVKRGERHWELTEPKHQSANWATVDSILFELESLRADKWVAEKPRPEHGLDKPQLTAEINLKGNRTIKFILDNLKRYGDELLR